MDGGISRPGVPCRPENAKALGRGDTNAALFRCIQYRSKAQLHVRFAHNAIRYVFDAQTVCHFPRWDLRRSDLLHLPVMETRTLPSSIPRRYSTFLTVAGLQAAKIC